MSDNILDEFNEILKSLDDLSPDKIQAFMVKILELFKKIHFNAEHGTEEEKKEALDFAAKIQNRFGKLQSKIDKNPGVDSGQFKNLFAFLEEDIGRLSDQKTGKSNSPIHLENPNKGRKKKKVIKKV